MRKQRLPKDFWTDIKPFDKCTYCFWYGDDQLKRCKVSTQKEAREFIKRAEDRNIAAFATAYVEEESENQVFACSFKSILAQYKFKDWVRLEIGKANYSLINYPMQKAEANSTKRAMEQFGSKEYGLKYDCAEYHISWFNTSKDMFEEEVFSSFQEANKCFEQKKKEDMPVRMIEKKDLRIHEVKVACQHIIVGMGKYLQQAANETLPIGEIPYIFSNKYLTSELEVKDGCGYMQFCADRKQCSIQIRNLKDGAIINIHSIFGSDMRYMVIVEDNHILDPWLVRIERRW